MGPLSNAEDLCFKHQNNYWSDMLEHPNYDEFWASRALGPDMRHLTAPVLLVGGWFDAEDLGGTLKLFRAIEDDGSAPAVTLVMGPWSHGEWSRQRGDKLGNLTFASNSGEYFRDKIEPPVLHADTQRPRKKNPPKSLDVRDGQKRMAQIHGLAAERLPPPFVIPPGRWKAFVLACTRRRRRV